VLIHRTTFKVLHSVLTILDKVSQAPYLTTLRNVLNCSKKILRHMSHLTDSQPNDLLRYSNISLQVVCFLLGNSPVSEFYMMTFRNTLSVPSS